MNDLTSKMRRRIKRKLSGEKPTLWIGKNGISQNLLEEAEKQLEQSEMVKVKILGSALESEDGERIASKVAEQTGASVVEVRGHTFMIYKRRGK
ncbi:MAG: YhbY family RNA-binding protein [Thermoproteota archaeon]